MNQETKRRSAEMNNAANRTARIRAAKRRRRRKRQIRILLLLTLLILVLGGAGTFLFRILKNKFSQGPVEPFQASREFDNPLNSGQEQRFPSFANSLCIVENDVLIETVSLDSNQTGVLFDLAHQQVLYSKGAYQKVYPASITKVMTAILALKYGNMDEIVTITQENVTLEEGAQVCGFWAGDRVKMSELVNALLVFSGNDAASAIATNIGGSMDGFVNMMNDYAAQIGCTGTHFTNPHGLHDENHYTTPYDIYLMLNEALKYSQFTDITQLSSYTLTHQRSDGTEIATVLPATDHYLTGEATVPKDVVILGGKTGTTTPAGNCLALLTQNAYGQKFVSIVMGAATKDQLYQQMSSLLKNINSSEG